MIRRLVVLHFAIAGLIVAPFLLPEWSKNGFYGVCLVAWGLTMVGGAIMAYRNGVTSKWWVATMGFFVALALWLMVRHFFMNTDSDGKLSYGIVGAVIGYPILSVCWLVLLGWSVKLGNLNRSQSGKMGHGS